MSDYTKALCGDWLNGKTVIVTGASGGMGAGIAATLIKILQVSLKKRALFLQFLLTTQVFFLNLRDLTDIHMKKLKKQ